MIDALPHRDRPGRSAARHHTRVARAWRRRRFGRRAPIYAFLIVLGLLVMLADLHLSSRWALLAGTSFGMFVMAVRMIPEALMPGFIFNWQLGAWGEQMTADELRSLPKDEWVVRHDLQWGEGEANHDHVVAGPAVYVLNSKNVRDSHVEIEGESLRLHRLDDPDNGYLADRWVPSALAEARSLRKSMRETLRYQVEVYPVIVIWGEFDLEPRWIGEVFILNGHTVVEWLKGRPTDLWKAERRQEVADYVRSMPRAKVAREVGWLGSLERPLRGLFSNARS